MFSVNEWPDEWHWPVLHTVALSLYLSVAVYLNFELNNYCRKGIRLRYHHRVTNFVSLPRRRPSIAGCMEAV